MLSLESTLGDETVLKNICDILDIDYEEVKKALPDPETDPLAMVNSIVPEGE